MNNENHDNDIFHLTPAQERALEFLIGGSTVEDAAIEAKVPRSVVRAWLTSDAAFIAALNAARKAQWEQVTARVLPLINGALYVLERTIFDPEVSRRDKLTAAGLVLKIGLETLGPPEGATDARDIKADMEVADLLRRLS